MRNATWSRYCGIRLTPSEGGFIPKNKTLQEISQRFFVRSVLFVEQMSMNLSKAACLAFSLE